MMTRTKKLIVGGIALLLVAGAVPVTCGPFRPGVSEASARDVAEDAPQELAVQTAMVRLAPVESVVMYSGNVEVRDEVEVLPKVSGQLLELKVDIGDSVKKGDIIAQIDTDSATVLHMQAEAGLQAAEAKLAQLDEGPRTEEVAQAEAALKNAQAKLDRLTAPLNQNEIDMAKAEEVSARVALQQAQAAYDKISWYDGKGAMAESVALQQATVAYEAALAKYEETMAGSKSEDIRAQEAAVEQAKAALELAKAPYRTSDYEIARADVLKAEAALYDAELQLNNCSVRAPIDGVVSAAPIAVGSIVGQSSAIVTLVSPKVEVTIKVEEASISAIREGQSATIEVAAFPGEQFAGKVTRISPTADQTDRTFQVRIEPEVQSDALRGGMFAQVNAISEQYALLVPRSAIVAEGGRSFVYVVKDGRVERREVETGQSTGKLVCVLSGLMSGEQVVSSGQTGLKDNTPVTVTTL